jgi:hypothetical protein
MAGQSELQLRIFDGLDILSGTFRPRPSDVKSLIKDHALDYDTQRWKMSNQNGVHAGYVSQSAIEEEESGRAWKLAYGQI